MEGLIALPGQHWSVMLAETMQIGHVQHTARQWCVALREREVEVDQQKKLQELEGRRPGGLHG